MSSLISSTRPVWSKLARARPSATFLYSSSARSTASTDQAYPVGKFYEAILNGDLGPSEKPVEPDTPPTPAAEPKKPARSTTRKPKTQAKPTQTKPTQTKTTQVKNKTVTKAVEDALTSTAAAAAPSTAEERAKIIFGSRLAGPAQRANRAAELRSRSKMVGGVLVPPKPEEPDNCCMSGCVNCVWDLFREEMEEWSAANEAAQRNLELGGDEAASSSRPMSSPLYTSDSATSMDDDGGGSGSGWTDNKLDSTHDGVWKEDLYRDLPVGIREFMKQEKKLKEKHRREGTQGG